MLEFTLGVIVGIVGLIVVCVVFIDWYGDPLRKQK